MKHVVKIKLLRRRQYDMGAMGPGTMMGPWTVTVLFSDGSHRKHARITQESFYRILDMWPTQGTFETLTVRREDAL